MKIIFRTLLIAIAMIILALLAAPMLVRQDQVKSFIENRVVLPDDRKLKLTGDLDFGLFPRAFVKVPQADILYKDGSRKTFREFDFGFHPSELLGKGVGFETSFIFGKNDIHYDGDIYIYDYENFYKIGSSPIKITLEEPLKIKLKADFSHSNNKYSLSNFDITHKQTRAKGTLEMEGTGNSQKLSLDTVIESDDIENIRRLIEFEKPENDKFNLLSGKGTVNLNINATGNSAEQLKSSLNGEGNVKMEDGAIYGLDLNEIIGAPQEVKMTDDENKKIDINEAEGKFSITNGAIRIEQLTASNQFTNITGQGIVDLVKNALKVAVDIDADVVSARVKIPLLISGSFDDIKFSPRVGDAIINNLDTIVDQGKKINLKNIRIDLKKGNVGEAVQQIRDIGKGFGIDLDKVTKGATEGIGAPAVQQPAAPNEPAAPASPPASIQDQQPQPQPGQ